MDGFSCFLVNPVDVFLISPSFSLRPCSVPSSSDRSILQIVAGLEKEAASAALPQFTRLLTQTLDFRRQHACGPAPQIRASADLVESESSSALVCLVMRLSEVELRPLFLHLCEWKAGVSAGDDTKATLAVLDRRLSFYKVLDGLAGALKVRRRKRQCSVCFVGLQLCQLCFPSC